MLVSSPGKSPRIHPSPSSTSIHYRRASNTSSYTPHQNASSSPHVGSLRKSQNSSQSSAGVTVKTQDASTQYSPEEQDSHRAMGEKKDKDPSKTPSTLSADKTAVQRQPAISEDARRRPPDIVPDSPSIKRTSGDASLSSNESSHKSPLKRAKPEVAGDKILPARYDLCDTGDLVLMMSNMLTDIVTINDQNQLNNPHLTRFHSRIAPGISARDYLQRLATHLALQPVILLTMVFYIDRLCSMYSDFTVNSLTCHRFLITAATVATKGLSDSFWNNSTYARVGGVKLSELALLELEFLYRVDWRIIPDNATLISYYHGLITRTDGYTLARSLAEKQLGRSDTNGSDSTKHPSTSTEQSKDQSAASSNNVAAGVDSKSITVKSSEEKVVADTATTLEPEKSATAGYE